MGDKSPGTGDTTTEVVLKTTQEAGQMGVMAEMVAQVVAHTVAPMVAQVVAHTVAQKAEVTLVEMTEVAVEGEKVTNLEIAEITVVTTARGHMVAKVVVDAQTDPPMDAPMTGRMVGMVAQTGTETKMAGTTNREARVVKIVATAAAQKAGRTVVRNPTPTPTRERVGEMAHLKAKVDQASRAKETHSVTSIRRRRITHETEFFPSVEMSKSAHSSIFTAAKSSPPR